MQQRLCVCVCVCVFCVRARVHYLVGPNTVMPVCVRAHTHVRVILPFSLTLLRSALCSNGPERERERARACVCVCVRARGCYLASPSAATTRRDPHSRCRHNLSLPPLHLPLSHPPPLCPCPHPTLLRDDLCVCACARVRACVRAGVRACESARVHAWVGACVRACVRACV